MRKENTFPAGSVGDHILSGHGMSIGEQAVEGPTGEGSATHRADCQGGVKRSKSPGRACQAKTSSAGAGMRERRMKIGMGY